MIAAGNMTERAMTCALTATLCPEMNFDQALSLSRVACTVCDLVNTVTLQFAKFRWPAWHRLR